MVDEATAPIEAGGFTAWLRDTRAALRAGRGMDVPCGSCVACCSSALFVHVDADEAAALAQIPGPLLMPAPGGPPGRRVMGHDAAGRCPMLVPGGAAVAPGGAHDGPAATAPGAAPATCRIYAHRPRTCRTYDCRVFAAAGLAAGGEERRAINERVERWRFTCDSPRARAEHAAVMATAAFIRDHAPLFPGGRVPADPAQLALLALKAYKVFLPGYESASGPDAPSEEARAAAIVRACREFDAGAGTPDAD